MRKWKHHIQMRMRLGEVVPIAVAVNNGARGILVRVPNMRGITSIQLHKSRSVHVAQKYAIRT